MACGVHLLLSGLGRKVKFCFVCFVRKVVPDWVYQGLWRTPPVKESMLCTFRVSAATFVLKARSRKTQADLAVVGGVIRFQCISLKSPIPNGKSSFWIVNKCKPGSLALRNPFFPYFEKTLPGYFSLTLASFGALKHRFTLFQLRFTALSTHHLPTDWACPAPLNAVAPRLIMITQQVMTADAFFSST